MLCKRIIPCLDIKDGIVVKGTNFVNLREAGSAVELAERYYEEGADELVFLDITATLERRKTLAELVEEVSKVIRIPFTVGGGISKIEDIEKLLNAGADKVSLNSSIVKNPNLISDASKSFGSQAIVAAIDSRTIGDIHNVYIKGGTEETELETISWCKKAEELGAGEILLTSMNKDGTKSGYDIELLKYLSENLTIPIIASGGAGTKEHFLEAFKYANVDACLAASLFHYKELEIIELKKYLFQNKVNVRL
ncbi:MAG: imidazole glycerol phosphate synthase subunit HisF [Ignavibacteriales bacterium]|nr:imidazole glycerol phosphate synthase subunit HisF [Ignavibacteriales bacterium]